MIFKPITLFRLFFYLTSMDLCIARFVFYITNEKQPNTMLFIIISALHVSGGFSAHHQELIKL